MTKFWKGILSSKDTNSSKRLVTLIVTAHFILASFVILFVATYIIFYLPKGKVDPVIMQMLLEVLRMDFYIILSGLGFVTVEQFGQMMLERTKLTTNANILTGSPTADTIKVETVNVAQETVKKDTKRQ